MTAKKSRPLAKTKSIPPTRPGALSPDGPIAAYVRVSSASQSGTMQRDAIRRVLDARGEDVFTEQWFEEKRSARTMDRPELERLRAAAREGKIRRLYVWKLDRLTRTGITDTLNLIRELDAHGCEVISIADGFNFRGPGAEMVIAALSWAAQMEWAAHVERRAAARERVIANGGTWGRPRSMTHAQLVKLKELRRQKKSIREIAAKLGIKRPTIAREVKRLESTPSKPTPATRSNKANGAATPSPSR